MSHYVTIFLACAFGWAAGWISANTVYRNALDRTALLTPIAVLDATESLEKLNPKSTPKEIAMTLEKVKNKAKRLKKAGFVVLKPNAVMAVPEEIYVKVED